MMCDRDMVMIMGARWHTVSLGFLTVMMIASDYHGDQIETKSCIGKKIGTGDLAQLKTPWE